ncbi:hypothetical protein [Sporosarcina sp. FA9]|uniref:hypothetical protein n=1 Tax=Sporosarcina sp. FA9 TaxID=3413030 RepID=UPI003F659D21
MSIVETVPFEMRVPRLFKWKVVNHKITAINSVTMMLNPGLAEAYFKYSYE